MDGPRRVTQNANRTDASARNRPWVSAAVFAFGNALPRAVGLVLLPLYARVLGPAAYGEVSLLLALGTAATFLLSFGLDVALFRTLFALEESPPEQRRYIASIWLFLFVAAPLGGLVLCGVMLAVRPRGFLAGPGDLALAIAAFTVLAIAVPVPQSVLRAAVRLKGYVILTLVSTIASTGAVLLAVVGLDLGPTGWMGALLVANVVTLGVACFLLGAQPPRPFDRDRVVSSLRLGVPLVPHYLSHWGLQLADRAVLATLVSATDLGVYSVAANLSLVALVAVQALNQSAMPAYARAASGRNEDLERAARTAAVQFSAVIGACVALALVVPGGLSFILPGAYARAVEIVPWLVLGYAFLGTYYIPMNFVTLVHGRSGGVWPLTVGSAVLNVGLLYALVPTSGLVVAGVASAASYGVLLAAVTAYAIGVARRRPLAGLSVKWRWYAGHLLGAGLLYAALASLTGTQSVEDFVARCVGAAVGLVGIGSCMRRALQRTPPVLAVAAR
jgi:O-antigen/teichoic acid export membrane protein